MAFSYTIIDLGNSILKIQNGIKFQSLHVSIFMKYLFSFGLYSPLNLVNITDFTLWNVKNFLLTESRLLLLSSEFSTLTSSSLSISCMYLSCWGVGHAHTHPLKLLHTTLKCFSHTHSVCFSKCQALPLAVCYTVVLTVVYLMFFILFFWLLLIICLSSLATISVIKDSHIFHST